MFNVLHVKAQLGQELKISNSYKLSVNHISYILRIGTLLNYILPIE